MSATATADPDYWERMRRENAARDERRRAERAAAETRIRLTREAMPPSHPLHDRRHLKFSPAELRWIGRHPGHATMPMVRIPKGTDLSRTNLTPAAQWAFNCNLSTRPKGRAR